MNAINHWYTLLPYVFLVYSLHTVPYSGEGEREREREGEREGEREDEGVEEGEEVSTSILYWSPLLLRPM